MSRLALSPEKDPRLPDRSVRERFVVQFVSKAITAPFRDGSKCLVRDLCLHLEDFEPHVMATREVPQELATRARVHSVYATPSRYAPTLLSNLRAFVWLLTRSPPDIFHFVFAPNPRTSAALRLLREWTGVPAVQTIASSPRTFARPERLLVGDVVVAQSRHTARLAEAAFADSSLEAPPIHVIPPPAPAVLPVATTRQLGARRDLGLSPTAPLFVYPGDLEVSRGAEFTLDLAASWPARLADARFLIAYRRKTAEADVRRLDLEQRSASGRVIFRAEVDDMHALLATATAIVFPVEDLYGKVDLPIVLLEALTFGVPVLVLDQGPLSELEGATRLPAEPGRWVDILTAFAENPGRAVELGAAGPEAIRQNYRARDVAARYADLYRRLLLPGRRC